jgi:hypothetical protein
LPYEKCAALVSKYVNGYRIKSSFKMSNINEFGEKMKLGFVKQEFTLTPFAGEINAKRSHARQT